MKKKREKLEKQYWRKCRILHYCERWLQGAYIVCYCLYTTCYCVLALLYHILTFLQTRKLVMLC